MVITRINYWFRILAPLLFCPSPSKRGKKVDALWWGTVTGPKWKMYFSPQHGCVFFQLHVLSSRDEVWKGSIVSPVSGLMCWRGSERVMFTQLSSLDVIVANFTWFQALCFTELTQEAVCGGVGRGEHSPRTLWSVGVRQHAPWQDAFDL